jgi:transposase
MSYGENMQILGRRSAGTAPSIRTKLVPTGRLAHFLRDLVRESLDVSAILKLYTEDRGFPSYDPTMMTALLL